MNTVFLIPKKGVSVPNPATGTSLPEDGADVTLDVYWQRRINDGDVEIADTTKPKKK
ncbi:DUF2635 domain-containing protein [Hydrocarboniphaga effusa]|uniref:DUF2635 domain-containing protein n=1 Tax=Hydrocarboniphaga effusa TaxID=243629 RepID=UPI003BAA3911